MTTKETTQSQKNKKELYELLTAKRDLILKSDKKIRQHVRSIKQGLHNASFQDAFIQQSFSYVSKI